MNTFIVARRQCGCVFRAEVVPDPHEADAESAADIGWLVIEAAHRIIEVSMLSVDQLSFPESCPVCAKEPK